MFERVWEKLLSILKSRMFFLGLVSLLLFGILMRRVFNLQIVHGEDYLNSFELKIEKRRSIPAARGNIYDKNGILLAYNELAYSVTMEDVYESGRGKNAALNGTLLSLVHLIERNGDSVISDFGIVLDQHNNFQFAYSGTSLSRFLADVYGKSLISDLSYKEQTSTAQDVVNYLAGSSRFGIGSYTDPDDRSSFVPGLGYTRDELLKVLIIRYAMSLNSYQKYIATTIARNVGEKTVAVVMENSDSLPGVAIAEDTIRRYTGGVSMSQVLGYTGKVSTEELEELREQNPAYTANDVVGKSGIEKYMELELQGTKGSETVYVDNVGKVIESANYIQPEAGNDVYLTVDSTLQQAVYAILEQKIAGIILSKLRNVKEYSLAEGGRASDIIIPIYDVYYALIGNGCIDISRFSKEDATVREKEAYAAWERKLDSVFAQLDRELKEAHTPYQDLPKEYQVYESLLVSSLNDAGIIKSSEVDTEDPTYIAWAREESISLSEYLRYAISQNWIDIAKLSFEQQYADSDMMFDKILEMSRSILLSNSEFSRRLYRYMLLSGEISPNLILEILYDQKPKGIPEEEIEALRSGRMEPYTFMRNRIENLDVTPQELALDPYSGSIVITNVNTGQVMALVSYPSYDNNRMANGVDADYYAKLRIDKSSPLINYATQQRTAPGSTFKMVSATAGLMEGQINEGSQFTCQGIFEEVTPSPRCWIYPGKHGVLNVTGAIEHSCNYFFYQLGYNM
ncbi:MAG: penicillin-binding protein, partial [Lachnospiraceae bacterium]|nr:penicillin-binding protein [Lachnospiraceae bacterium]